MSNSVITGKVVFSNVENTDIYNGKDTGWYSLMISLGEAEASKLTDVGVKVKTYTPEEGEPTLQRKFKTRKRVPVVDMDNQPISGEIPFGSEVRILWSDGGQDPHPEHGTSAYMNRVRVVELSDGAVPEEF